MLESLVPGSVPADPVCLRARTRYGKNNPNSKPSVSAGRAAGYQRKPAHDGKPALAADAVHLLPRHQRRPRDHAASGSPLSTSTRTYFNARHRDGPRPPAGDGKPCNRGYARARPRSAFGRAAGWRATFVQRVGDRCSCARPTQVTDCRTWCSWQGVPRSPWPEKANMMVSTPQTRESLRRHLPNTAAGCESSCISRGSFIGARATSPDCLYRGPGAGRAGYARAHLCRRCLGRNGARARVAILRLRRD